MTVIPQSVSARNNGTQNVHFIRKTINYSDANIGAPVNLFAKIPARSIILSVHVDVETVFNAGTTNVLTFGTTAANANEIVEAADVSEAGVADTDVTRARGSLLSATADIGIYAKYTQSGTAATAGKANVVITYAPDNDG